MKKRVWLAGVCAGLVVSMLAARPAFCEKASGPAVVIDAGHQGSWVDMSAKEPMAPGSSEMKVKCTTGTVGNYTNVPEFQLNLVITLKLKEALEERGYTVYLTRNDNSDAISNMERALVATEKGAAATVRIHGNSLSDPSVSGAVGMCMSPSNPYVADLYKGSFELANKVLESYCAETGFENLGVQYYDDMTGFNWSKVPVMILELGFMSNESDDRAMQDPAMQEKMVQGIANGLDQYFSYNIEETSVKNAEAEAAADETAADEVTAEETTAEEAAAEETAADEAAAEETAAEEAAAEEAAAEETAAEETAAEEAAAEETAAEEAAAEEAAAEETAAEEAAADGAAVDDLIEDELIEDEIAADEIAAGVNAEAEEAERKMIAEKMHDLLGDVFEQDILSGEEKGEKWAVSYTDLAGEEKIEYNPHLQMQSASVIKVFIMGAVYDRICYPATPEDEIYFTDSYPGELRSILERMIHVSDNNAANDLIAILGGGDSEKGMQVVNDFCRKYGYNDTHLGRRFLESDPKDDNYTSSADCAAILEDIYRGKLAGSEASEKMLTILKGQQVLHKIPSVLPPEYSSANKTGEMPLGYGLGCIENDIAIVFGPEGDYILCVLSNELDGRNDMAQETIRKISRAVTVYNGK